MACHFPGGALHRSNYRRLQRFFQFARLDGDVVARLVVIMLGLEKRKLVLALDRTNWKLGKSDVNILVLAVVTRRFRIPLMWSFLAHGGSSDHKLRCVLMDRFVRQFGADQIEMLLADREFVGGKWLQYLNNNKITFAIRLKVNMFLHRETGGRVRLENLLRNPRGSRVWTGWLAEMPRTQAHKLTLKCKRISHLCFGQGGVGLQFRFSVMSVFARITSFRMTAVSATLNGFPLATRFRKKPENWLSFFRVAASAAM